MIRSNLKLNILRVNDKHATLLCLLRTPLFQSFLNEKEDEQENSGSVIIYCIYQNQADTLCSYLKSNGFNSESYHAGKTDKYRNEIQKNFVTGKTKIIVATIAFGMGIDKSNVRSVIHFCIPSTLEDYIQQIGRAGRDGKDSHCLLFLHVEDYHSLKKMCHKDSFDLKSLKKFFGLFPSIKKNSSYFSIPIEKTERELDMKRDLMKTLLSWMHLSQTIQLFSPIHFHFKISFLKTDPSILSKKDSLIEHILEKAQKKNGYYVLDIVSASNSLKSNPLSLQSSLQKLFVKNFLLSKIFFSKKQKQKNRMKEK